MLVFGYVFCSSSSSSIWVKSRWKTLSYVHSGVWQCMHHTQLKWSTAKTRICNKNSVTFWIVTHQPIEQAMRCDDPRKQCSDALIWLFHLALLSLNTFLSFCRWNGRMSVLMRPERESALRTHTHTHFSILCIQSCRNGKTCLWICFVGCTLLLSILSLSCNGWLKRLLFFRTFIKRHVLFGPVMVVDYGLMRWCSVM